MSNLDFDNISVINEHFNPVYVKGRLGEYCFKAARKNRPTEIVIPMSELKFINSDSDVILTGWLTFLEDEKEAIYKELRIADWKDILTNKDIEDILLHPTIEKLQKIIDIDNIGYIDRIRMTMHSLTNEGHPITSKVVDIVNTRFYELQKRIRKSNITLQKKPQPIMVNDEMDALKTQNESLRKQMDEMQKMMQQMMQQMAATPTASASEEPKKTNVRKTAATKTTK